MRLETEVNISKGIYFWLASQMIILQVAFEDMQLKANLMHSIDMEN